MREAPHRALALPGFLYRATRELSKLGSFDRAILHFLVPCGFPLGLVAKGELEVVAHGSDVRLLVHMPRAVRERVLASLLEREAKFRFASVRLREELVAGLSSSLADSLRARSRVELPAMSVPDVRTRASVLRKSVALVEGEHLWLSCARLVPGKGVDRAITKAARSGARLVVVGDGPERARLEALAQQLDARVQFVGQLPREEALAWIAAADRLVHLSEAEGAPTVIREARALGTRVLATAVGDVALWAQQDPGIEIASPFSGISLAPLRPGGEAPGRGFGRR